MRLIDADKLKDKLEEEREYSASDYTSYAEEHGLDTEDDWHFSGLERAMQLIDEQPSVSVVIRKNNSGSRRGSNEKDSTRAVHKSEGRDKRY